MSSTDELKKYYADLLIVQYRGKPKARSMIEALVEQVLMDQLPSQLEDAFDLDTAVGRQLDILGSRLGVSRNVYLRNGDPITLNDTDFRTFIKLQAARMTLTSSLWDIQSLLIDFFQDQIRVFDNLNMTMDYFVFGESSTLISVLIKQDMLPRPTGVGIKAVYDLPYKKVYGFQTYSTQSYPVVGFNTYENYDEETSWIEYSNAEFLV